MIRSFFVLLIALVVQLNAFTQQVDRPKLIVGIVVDQMRWDYLYRFADRYGNDGFRKLVNQGFTCENTFIPYTPTYTAAGHASIYTGASPAIHGIIGNAWYNRELHRSWYCTEDSTVAGVGSNNSAGKMSPRNMWSTSITDELRLASNFRSKVIGIAIKDRGAILPAGHSANAAYWFDNAIGGWISSNYYMTELPQWVQQLNARKLPDQYLQKDWTTLYPIETYRQSGPDDRIYESKMSGGDNTFPHETSKITANKYEAFKQTPSGNTFTLDMAKAAIEGEKLGQTGNTDFLAMSFSSTDYIGHAFGPNSIEVEDAYLRLDREIAAFLKYLDAKIGKGQYLIFLSADHGVAHAPGFLREHKLPGGAFDDANIRNWLNAKAKDKFGVDIAIEQVVNYQLYLDLRKIDSAKIDGAQFRKWAVGELKQHPAIMSAFDLNELPSTPIPAKIKEMVTLGFNQKLSGDIQFIFKPGWFDGWDKGTTHGAWNPYDSHIPLLFYGWKVKPGKTNRETYMTDIAPTIAAMLRIQMPNGTIGHVIEEVTK